jgi:hypothetical protein
MTLSYPVVGSSHRLPCPARSIRLPGILRAGWDDGPSHSAANIGGIAESMPLLTGYFLMSDG